MAGRRLKFWGWGYEGNGLEDAEVRGLLATFANVMGLALANPVPAPEVEEIDLAKPRLEIPKALAEICTTEPFERVLHTYGQSFPDSARIFERDFRNAPDIVAYPRDEADIAALLDWAGDKGAAAIPYGGGSSVVGGVEPAVGDTYKAAVTIDMTKLDRMLEIDETSRAARIQGGALGPRIEAQLKPCGLTLRHFPQSFEQSTLGGWIATRSGGHFAALYTHIYDLVESVRMVTPTGVIESQRPPGSGAGSSPDRLIVGSEGSLGIITEAWMRLQGRPRFEATAGIRFRDFLDAAAAVRAVAQAGLHPANLCVVDGVELMANGVGDGTFTLMAVSFDSADRPVDALMERALECCADHGGEADWREGPDAGPEDLAGAWRTAFIRMPYNREVLTPRAIISDTLETSIAWDRLEGFYHAVKGAIEQAICDATGREGTVSCRISHVWPDGPALSFGFHAEGTPGNMVPDWRAIKDAASDAVIRAGSTITDHRAVGRDHMKWLEQQRPAQVGEDFAAAKQRLDPKGILNPGVVIAAPRGGVMAKGEQATTRPTTDFAEFWPIYLRAHSRPQTRAAHYMATVFGLVAGLGGIITGTWWLVAAAVVGGYGIAIAGHSIFERNKPLVYPHTIMAIGADLKLTLFWATGRLQGELEKYQIHQDPAPD